MCMQVCPICLTNAKDLAFGCGHMVRYKNWLISTQAYNLNKYSDIVPFHMKDMRVSGNVFTFCFLFVYANDSVAESVGRTLPDAQYVERQYGPSWGCTLDDKKPNPSFMLVLIMWSILQTKC
jgi:hypothetical protein